VSLLRQQLNAAILKENLLPDTLPLIESEPDIGGQN
jgi:hypothetical protein